MADYSLPPEPRVPAPTSLRLSKFDALKTAASNPAAVIIAIGTAIGAITTALKTSSDSEATAKVSYETLRAAVERNAAQGEACRQSTLELTSWVKELSDRLERRQATTEKVIKTKVTRATSAPVPAPVVEPAPPAPAPPAATQPTPLPSFEGLGLRAQSP